MKENNNKSDLRKFFIKLAAITLAVIIILNVTFNLIFADKLESINMILSLNKKSTRDDMCNMIKTSIRQVSRILILSVSIYL